MLLVTVFSYRFYIELGFWAIEKYFLKIVFNSAISLKVPDEYIWYIAQGATL